MSEKLPKILSVSLSAWRDSGNVHTQTDLFKFWRPDRVAQIYVKSELPETDVCNSFFQISENSVVKSVLNRKKVGRRVENAAVTDTADQKAIKQEQKLYTVAHKRKSWFLTLAREIVWSLGCWKSRELNEFIESESPDVYFIPIYPVVYMCKLQRYILKKYPKPYVCYLADDNYSCKVCRSPLSFLHRMWLRKHVKQLAQNCDEMFTITETQARETDRLFGTKSRVLTKGLDYVGLRYKSIKPDTPVKMVYTGNMQIGRDASIIEIAKAVSEINKSGEKIRFDIYSPTVLSNKKRQFLNTGGVTHHGNVDRLLIADIQGGADIVVFAESLEKKHRYAARLSFSTKLTDYFKSGKCIFAVGDHEIAPIEYLRNNDCAVICNEYSEIKGKLQNLIDNPDLINEYGKKSFNTGKKNHNEELIKETFISAFLDAAKEKNEKNSNI